MLPRHSAGSFELKEGTGPITTMLTCGEFLEIYKTDKTFRVRSPESIDPDETNPNAGWTSSPVDDVGSGNPIVARVLLQSSDMLNAGMFESNIDKEAVISTLHSCKEALIACEKISIKVTRKISKIVESIEQKGIDTDNHGRGLNPFPHVNDLDANCGTFLIQANRAIKHICKIPWLFFSLSRTDSNFEYLGNRLKSEISDADNLIQFVKDNAKVIRYLIELRNFHEHPNEKRTIINNFTLTPDLKIQLPTWQISGDTQRSICEEINSAVSLLTDIAEVMFIHVVMAAVSKKIPYIVEQVEETKIDPSNPKRYRLAIDVNQMQFK